MRFFEAINRWQIAVATLAVVVGVDFGIYSFSRSPERPPASGPLQGQSLTVPIEGTAPSTAQYRP